MNWWKVLCQGDMLAEVSICIIASKGTNTKVARKHGNLILKWASLKSFKKPATFGKWYHSIFKRLPGKF